MVNRSYSQGNPCQAIFRSLSVSEIPEGPIANHVMRILDTWTAQVALYVFIHSFSTKNIYASRVSTILTGCTLRRFISKAGVGGG